MKQKNTLIFAGMLIAVFFLSGCGEVQTQKDETKKEDNGYLGTMMDINQKAKQDIQNATDKENARLKETLGSADNSTKQNTMDYAKQYTGAILKTNFGNITIKFYNADSPNTVSNFLKLADQKLYNGTKFHRVIKDFMIQGGDPNSKDNNWDDDGKGGPGYSFKDEFNAHKLVRGSLAMANSGPNTNGSQFFIVTAVSTPWLDGKHTNFGEVTGGMDVLDKIENVEVNANAHPLEDVTIQGITLVK